MIYLLFGKDQYRLSARLRAIIKSAGITDDGINFTEVSSDFVAATIISEATAMPFLSDKRVLVLRGLLSTKNKELLSQINDWLSRVPLETELIFVEDEAPDQRLTIVKTLNKIAKVENFANLIPGEVVKIVEKMTADRGATIDRAAASLLQMYVGTDLARIENEVGKLAAYSKKIDTNSVELLVDAGYFNTVFDLTDAIATKNSKKAISNLQKILESGESEVYLVTMIAMQVRNLLLVQDLKSHGLSESEVTSKSKLHPFVVKKSLSQIRNFNTEQLITMHHGLLDLDIAMKTGLGEPKTLLTQFILESII